MPSKTLHPYNVLCTPVQSLASLLPRVPLFASCPGLPCCIHAVIMGRAAALGRTMINLINAAYA